MAHDVSGKWVSRLHASLAVTLHRVGVVNVPVKVGPRAWATCWRTMARKTGAFGANESLSRRQRAVYAALCAARGWGQYGLRKSPNPLFWSKDTWTKVPGSGRVVELHPPGPWARTYPGYNGARYATIVVLERRSGQRHAFVNAHLVSAGHKVPAPWREQVRADSFAQLRELVHDLTDLGLVVWLLGDMNMPQPFPMGHRFTWVRGVGIDKLGVSLPAGVTLGDHSFDLARVPSDHKHGLVCRVHLTKG